MRGTVLAVLAILSAGAPAIAAETGLTIEGRADAYPHGEPSPQAWFRGTFKLQASPLPKLFVRVRWVLERDSAGEIRRDELYRDDDRGIARAASRFDDLLVGVRVGRATVEVGKQRLTWGRTTFIQATDNLTPRDWTDPLDEVRLSPWSVRASFDTGTLWVDGAVVPRYAPSRLPRLGGRWFAVAPAVVPNPAFPTSGPPALRVVPAYGTDDFPAVTWSTLQGAIRGGYRGARGEGTISVFRGYDDAPVLTAVPGLPDPVAGTVPVTLHRAAARLDVYGADGEVLAGAWIVRGEAGYFRYPSGERDAFVLYQVEAQWSRGSWLAIAGYGDATGGTVEANAPTALDLAFLPAVFVRGQYGEATEWRVAADGVYGVDGRDGLVRLSGSYPVAANVRAGAEAALLWGAADTFFGHWRDNDRLRAFVTLSF